MIVLGTKELYALFLECDWWRELTMRKRRKVGKCEKCSTQKRLESHHLRYPENWFDTTEEDLQVLCDDCHREEHGIKKAKPEPPKPAPLPPGLEIKSWSQLRNARQARLIDKVQFRALKAVLKPKKKRRLRRREKRNLKPLKPIREFKFGPALNFEPKRNWVSRGASSN